MLENLKKIKLSTLLAVIWILELISTMTSVAGTKLAAGKADVSIQLVEQLPSGLPLTIIMCSYFIVKAIEQSKEV